MTIVACSADPLNAQVHANFGLFLAEKDPAQAERLYRRAILLDDGNPHALYNLGSLLDSQGRWEEASEAYRRAISVDPLHAYALFNLAIIVEDRLGDFAQAESLYERAVASRPSDEALRLDYASFLWVRMDRPEAALRHFERCMSDRELLKDRLGHCLRSRAVPLPPDLQALFE
jgi:Tfp pilus assembly protein PilF